MIQSRTSNSQVFIFSVFIFLFDRTFSGGIHRFANRIYLNEQRQQQQDYTCYHAQQVVFDVPVL